MYQTKTRMLAKVKIYKGIEFIELNDLTPEQAASFTEWAPKEAFIKILIKDKVISNCIQYKDYRVWHQSQMGDKQHIPTIVRIEQDLAVNVKKS
jgi:phosphopantetheinyl transferase (holo-ACP synthase)